MATSSSTTSNLLLLLSPHSHAHPPPPPQPPPWHHQLHSTLSLNRHVPTTSVVLSLRPSWNVLVVCASKSDRSSNFGFDNDDDGEEQQLGGKSRRGRRRRSSSRKWWFDEEEYSSVVDQPKVGSSLWDQIVDSLWVLKVLRSYGWFSPIIMLSLLLATGPKAFIMAFSVLLGVSLVILAYNKLLERLKGIPKPRRRRRRTRSPFNRVEKTETEEDDLEDFDLENRYQKRVYQSAVARKSGSMNGGVTESSSNGSFGGWDDLLGEEEIDLTRRFYQEIEKQEVRQQKESSALSRRDGELPLLLKLLVAVFPFLESWTNFP